MDAIETKRCTETTLTEDQQLLCAPLLAYFESKVFPREVSAAYLRYWRAGPAALELLRSFATEKRPRRRPPFSCGRVDGAFMRPCRRDAGFMITRATATITGRDIIDMRPPPRHRRDVARRQGEPRRPLLLAPSQTEEVARLARIYRQSKTRKEEAREGGEGAPQARERKCQEAGITR